MSKKISDILPMTEILAQLAEEASELAQAALKLRRALDGTNPTPKSVELMAMLSVEDISEITSRNPKFCRIKRATFTCDFCTTSVDVCDERIATTLADSGKTPSCPICGETMRLISCDVTVRD